MPGAVVTGAPCVQRLGRFADPVRFEGQGVPSLARPLDGDEGPPDLRLFPCCPRSHPRAHHPATHLALPRAAAMGGDGRAGVP